DFIFIPGADQVVFSLTPGSPSLGGFGPGDLFTSEGFGFFTLYCQAGQLGLGPLDNLNMVDYVPCDDVHACVTDWAIGYVNPCVGDLNGDGVVNLSDLAILLSSYGKCEGEPGYIPEADLEPDGCVNLTDLAVLLAHYGETCLASPVVPEP
ncbi:MAG: dockerin type I domain-containing protein, partial [Phycisphaerae bacterium]